MSFCSSYFILVLSAMSAISSQGNCRTICRVCLNVPGLRRYTFCFLQYILIPLFFSRYTLFLGFDGVSVYLHVLSWCIMTEAGTHIWNLWCQIILKTCVKRTIWNYTKNWARKGCSFTHLPNLSDLKYERHKANGLEATKPTAT